MRSISVSTSSARRAVAATDIAPCPGHSCSNRTRGWRRALLGRSGLVSAVVVGALRDHPRLQLGPNVINRSPRCSPSCRPAGPSLTGGHQELPRQDGAQMTVPFATVRRPNQSGCRAGLPANQRIVARCPQVSRIGGARRRSPTAAGRPARNCSAGTGQQCIRSESACGEQDLKDPPR